MNGSTTLRMRWRNCARGDTSWPRLSASHPNNAQWKKDLDWSDGQIAPHRRAGAKIFRGTVSVNRGLTRPLWEEFSWTRGVLINGDGFWPMTFALIEAQRLRRSAAATNRVLRRGRP